ncbi:MAG: hypothetical protein AB7O60_00010 [Variibacter sp.]
MKLIGRLFVIFFACLLASFAAGMVVTLAVAMPAWSQLDLGTMDQGPFDLMWAFGVIFISAYALVPLLIVVVAAEAFSIRSALFYAVAGALLGCVLYLQAAGWAAGTVDVQGFARREIEIMAAAGIVAGFVYWLVAGRSAGRWHEPPPGAPPPAAI